MNRFRNAIAGWKPAPQLSLLRYFFCGAGFQPAWFALTLVALMSLNARAGELSTANYRASLEKIRAELNAGNLSGAQIVASKLEGAQVISAGVAYKPDATILQPIHKAKNIGDLRAQIARIDALLKTLPSDASAANSTASATSELNPALLNDLRSDEEMVYPKMDGKIDDVGIVDSGIWAMIRKNIVIAIRWCAKQISNFMDWINNLFPNAKNGFGEGVAPYITYICIGLAALAAAIGIRVHFQNRRFKPLATDYDSVSAPVPAKDADPLSRDSGEWEEYAARLASSGRHREAVRAWYHAVLAALFRSGVLNYRKGRTNWEYYFSFPAEFAFRRDFQELTGSFEMEWYGKNQSDPGDAGRYGDAAKQFLTRARAGRNA